MKTVFRLCSKRYPANDGKGAALKGGRWNPAGTEVIYTSVTASLAALEVLANYSVLPRDFMLTEIQIPDTVAIEYVTGDLLPAGWNSSKPISETQELGGRWTYELRSLVLSVPSSLIPAERNFVINPAHADFEGIVFLASAPFIFDPRLKDR